MLGFDISIRSDKVKDLTIIMEFSLLIVIVFHLIFPTVYVKDSRTYIDFASLLLGKTDSAVEFRTPGYPLLLLFTGVLQLDTFRYLIVFQTFLATIIPIFCYLILIKITTNRIAFWGTIFSMITLFPYMYMKTVMTEHVYIFFHIFGIWIAAEFLYSGRKRYIYLSALALSALLFIRPAASLLFLIWFLMFLLAKPRVWYHLIIACLLILGTHYSWNALKTNFFNLATSSISSPSWTGRLSFWNIYIYGIKIKKSNGPNSARFISLLEKHLDSEYGTLATINPGPLRRLSDEEYYFDCFKGNPKGLLKEILDAPSRTYLAYIYSEQIYKSLPIDTMDELFLKVSLEALKSKPASAFFLYYFKFMQYVTGTTQVANYQPPGLKTVSMPLFPYQASEAYHGLIRHGYHGLYQEIKDGKEPNRLLGTIQWFLHSNWSRIISGTRFVAFLGMLAGGLIYFRSRHVYFIWLCILTVMYQVAIVSVFQPPLWRYIFQTILIEILVGVTAVPILISWANKFFFLDTKT